MNLHGQALLALKFIPVHSGLIHMDQFKPGQNFGLWYVSTPQMFIGLRSQLA
jgi:hypothetical protein